MTCASNPAAPAGYTLWKGPVPQPIVDWAISIRDHIFDKPFGYTQTLNYAGQTVLARVDHHSWSFVNGHLVTGLCWKGVTIYSPLPAPATGTGLTPAPILSSSDQAVISQVGQTPDSVTPDPSYAMYPQELGTNWPLVGACAVAILAVGGLFALALKHAGQP
jgi:hypothetical protein